MSFHRFSATPTTLVDPRTKVARAEVTVEVKSLFHHYFIAKYGEHVKDRGEYEYERQLTAGTDWRFRGGGIGFDREAKRNVSNELGKAFARWFHYEHLGFTYFCPFEDVLGRRNADGTTWQRKEGGDLPDYVCGVDERDVNLLEAKGRYTSVTVKTKEFEDFRKQIARAQLLDERRNAIQVKGFISVARWATEETPRVRSRLLVEDPTTDGEPPGQRGYPQQVGRSMVAGHYAPVLERLQLPVHAEAIRDARPISGVPVLTECRDLTLVDDLLKEFARALGECGGGRRRDGQPG